MTCKWTLRQLFICLRPPPLLGFCLGWYSNFVISETVQKQSVKLLKNMVSNTTQHPLTLSQPHNIFYFWKEGGGGEVNQREG
jgi:hypothetical protein